MTTLWDTDAAAVTRALSAERRAAGSVATGLVLSLVVVVGERAVADVLAAASAAAAAHPCRIITAVCRAPDAPTGRLDAEVHVGGSAGPAELVMLRMEGRLALHAESVVLPLLAPDSPVVTWWRDDPPQRPVHDPLGALASRRITDAASADDPIAALLQREGEHHAGDTDLAWTRTTPWRALLASALDAGPLGVSGVLVEAAPGNASALLLAAWLSTRLQVAARLRNSRGPGITLVQLDTPEGPVRLDRPTGSTATLVRPGREPRVLPLARRELPDLLAEELRRLGDDEVYGETLHAAARLAREAPAT